MILFAILFLTGDLLFQQLTFLPALKWIVIAFISSLIFFSNKRLKLIAVLTLGFTWTGFYAHHELAWSFPLNQERIPIIATGYIASIPDNASQNASFLFSLKKINAIPANGLVKLSWRYPSYKLLVGDKWQFILRLKKIHGLMNPGGFNYEVYAFQQNIKAQGYIVENEDNKIIEHHIAHDFINRLRQTLKEKMEMLIPKSDTSPWIIALAVGERHGIPQENWQVLRNTGTNHLMAIAGLHIGFMSGLIFFIVNFIWRRIPAASAKFPAQHAGSVGALCMTFIYSALSGFNIPAARASIMISVFLIFTLLRRKIPAWNAWSIALLVIVMFNPMVILSDSFWLSFGSVALIIYGMRGRLSPQGIWWKWGRVQWVIAIGLIPLSVALFHQVSIVSFVANSIAIPWVACIIVPSTLLGCFLILISHQMSAYVFLFTDKNLSLLWKVLAWFSHFSGSTWYQFIPMIWIILFASASVLLLLVPKGFPGRWFGIVWLLPLILYHPVLPKTGEIHFTLLEVGQGLSIVIQTNNHVLLYDAGPSSGDNYDMGENVVLPFLQSQHIKVIDKMILSDSENAYMGGAPAVIKGMKVREIVSPFPEYFAVQHAKNCLAETSWRWDEVDFKMLDLTHSCVLKISSGSQSILLTGNLKNADEKKLLKSNALDLNKIVVLVAPHFGSKGSSLESFIETTHPQYVLFSVGYRNRFHFPNEEVLKQYQAMGAFTYTTVDEGAMQFALSRHAIQNITFHRLMHLFFFTLQE